MNDLKRFRFRNLQIQFYHNRFNYLAPKLQCLPLLKFPYAKIFFSYSNTIICFQQSYPAKQHVIDLVSDACHTSFIGEIFCYKNFIIMTCIPMVYLKPLSANRTKWSNRLKQFVGCYRRIA